MSILPFSKYACCINFIFITKGTPHHFTNGLNSHFNLGKKMLQDVALGTFIISKLNSHWFDRNQVCLHKVAHLSDFQGSVGWLPWQRPTYIF